MSCVTPKKARIFTFLTFWISPFLVSMDLLLLCHYPLSLLWSVRFLLTLNPKGSAEPSSSASPEVDGSFPPCSDALAHLSTPTPFNCSWLNFPALIAKKIVVNTYRCPFLPLSQQWFSIDQAYILSLNIAILDDYSLEKPVIWKLLLSWIVFVSRSRPSFHKQKRFQCPLPTSQFTPPVAST